MNIKKHRIVGALVLIALAIIFLPLLFQEHKGPNIRIEDIPSRPTQPDMTPPKDLPAPIMMTPAKQASTPVAWALQMGSFNDAKRAQQLVERLRTKGYAAYTRSATVGTATINRVYVGPEFDQAKLKMQATQLQKTMHLKGAIVTYRAIPGTENG